MAESGRSGVAHPRYSTLAYAGYIASHGLDLEGISALYSMNSVDRKDGSTHDCRFKAPSRFIDSWDYTNSKRVSCPPYMYSSSSPAVTPAITLTHALVCTLADNVAAPVYALTGALAEPECFNL